MGKGHGVAMVAGPEGTRVGLRAIWISAVVLAVAAAVQLAIYTFSGSAALFADALGNVGDAATTVVLALAFIVTRRAADRRYTFGLQRAEDLAGVFVVLVIWVTAGLAGWEAYRKLDVAGEVSHVWLAMAAAAFGGLSNEAVARYKINVGRRIGSPPLVADGQHARTDALASLAAVVGLAGVQAGFPLADPIAAFAITAAIAWIAIGVSREVFLRLLDAVDPEVIERLRHLAAETPGVVEPGRVQARFAGRSLYVTLTVAADGNLSLNQAHDVAEAVHHRIIHGFPGVAQVDVHVDPWEAHAADAHRDTVEHPPVQPDPHHREHPH